MAGVSAALVTMVVFPLIVSGYLSYALRQGGAKRLWRDGLLIVLALLPFAYSKRGLVFWYGGPLAAEGVQTSAFVVGTLVAVLVVHALAHRRVPPPLRVTSAAIAIAAVTLALTGVS
jgi:hypothetical protein